MSPLTEPNVILATDSYKLTHWHQYPADAERVYSYMEARTGARFPYTIFFGLQAIITQHLKGPVVTEQKIDEAAEVAAVHFGGHSQLNTDGWRRLLARHGGQLPLEIKAVPEGTVVPVGNVLMTVENTDPEFPWLTNVMESLLLHVWYPSTVATVSYATRAVISAYLETTATNADGLDYMLHDFGYRGATSHESAGIGGAAHLLNFKGTDTLAALLTARDLYDADLAELGFSVPATEHSVMTARGAGGEFRTVQDLLDHYPTGVLSVVADSYDVLRFVREIGSTFKEQILARDGKLVVRPDSTTPEHPTPESEVAWILAQLWSDFGGTVNARGYKVLDPHVGVLWGDGIDTDGIERILAEMARHGFSAENIVFGMGGGLLQKVNRDTQRFAIKASAISRGGVWHDVQKNPLDQAKRSKAGRLALVQDEDGELRTVRQESAEGADLLATVFRDGELTAPTTFATVRGRVRAGRQSSAHI